MLCALKCDLREEHEKDEAEGQALIQYQEGLDAAKRIGALRYLGMLSPGPGEMRNCANVVAECSAMRNRGVSEAFTEAARVALSVKPTKAKESSKCTVM